MSPSAPYASQLAHLGAETRSVPAAALLLKMAVLITIWSRRARTRRALGQLDDHLLKDIGLDRWQARAESGRKFWQE